VEKYCVVKLNEWTEQNQKKCVASPLDFFYERFVFFGKTWIVLNCIGWTVFNEN
jgi:hypothetical protein